MSNVRHRVQRLVELSFDSDWRSFKTPVSCGVVLCGVVPSSVAVSCCILVGHVEVCLIERKLTRLGKYIIFVICVVVVCCVVLCCVLLW